MELQIALAATKTASGADRMLAELAYAWVMTDDVKTRTKLIAKLKDLKIPAKYKTKGPIYRQISLTQTQVEKAVKAAPDTIVLKLKPTALSSWTTSKSSAENFAGEHYDDVSKSVVILRTDLVASDCLIYFPAFVKSSPITNDVWLEIAGGDKKNFALFMRRTTNERGENEALVLNSPKYLQFKRDQLIGLRHVSKDTIGDLAKLAKSLGALAQFTTFQGGATFYYKKGTRSINLNIQAGEFTGTARFTGGAANLGGAATKANVEILIEWVSSRKKEVPFTVVRKNPIGRRKP